MTAYDILYFQIYSIILLKTHFRNHIMIFRTIKSSFRKFNPKIILFITYSEINSKIYIKS